MSEDKETKVVTWDELNHEHQKCLRWPDHGPLRAKSKYDQMEMVQADDMRRRVGSGLLGRAQRAIEARDLTIESLEQKLIALEQQLKTAKADGVREFKQWLINELGDEYIDPDDCELTVTHDEFEEYANNLEGK